MNKCFVVTRWLYSPDDDINIVVGVRSTLELAAELIIESDSKRTNFQGICTVTEMEFI